MDSILNLYGFLILTFIGFVLPILTIFLSLFPDGLKWLTDKYENEKKQSETNIKSESLKPDINCGNIKKNIKVLEKKKREAQRKLNYLNSGKFIHQIFPPFLLSFLLVLFVFLNLSIIADIIFIFLSLTFFIYGIYVLFAIISVLIEVSAVVKEKNEKNNEKIIELLTTLVEKSGIENLYIDEKQIYGKIDKKPIIKDVRLEYSVGKKYDIPVSVVNLSEKMGKNIELGFVFPTNVLIEKADSFSLYSSEDTQIVRFNMDIVQSKEDTRSSLGLTFLESKEYIISTFIKGENVKRKSVDIIVNVIK